MTIPNRRAAGEIAAVVATSGLFLVFENLLDLKLPFLAAAILAWGVYLVPRIIKNPAAWGLRRDNLKAATLQCLPFFIGGVLLLGGYRLWRGWIPLPHTAITIFAIYPLWAFVQQFVLQSIVSANLERLGLRRWAIVATSAVLFGLGHVPDLPLAALCAASGVVWTALYLRRPNLIPIALTHAWLGALAYYWVLERNPWLEMFPQ